MIPEREREALMRLTMCAREECIMCKYHKECDFDFQYKLATESMNILANALRKTEPTTEDCSTVEPQNYCDDCLYCDTCDSKEFFYACTSKATISKMEQVEDETRLTAKCLNCANGGSYKCSKCDGEMYYKYDKDEPQIETSTNSEKVQLTDEPQTCSVNGRPYSECSSCEHFKCTADEPQTDCPWK